MILEFTVTFGRYQKVVQMLADVIWGTTILPLEVVALVKITAFPFAA